MSSATSTSGRRAPSSTREGKRAGGSASLVVAAHPSSTATDSSASPAGSSGQVSPRHPPAPAYGCFLPDLTGFAGWRRAGPDLRRPVPGATADPPGLGRGFSPAEADCGYRAPLAPRLARPPRRVYARLRQRPSQPSTAPSSATTPETNSMPRTTVRNVDASSRRKPRSPTTDPSTSPGRPASMTAGASDVI